MLVQMVTEGERPSILAMLTCGMWNPWTQVADHVLVQMVTEGERPEIPDNVPADFADLIRRCWHQACLPPLRYLIITD